MITYRHHDLQIVASGHNHYPYVPDWKGTNLWLAGTDRQILHSIFYRQPDDYAGKTVLVVGDGASGRDIAQQVSPVALKVRVTALRVCLVSNGITDIRLY